MFPRAACTIVEGPKATVMRVDDIDKKDRERLMPLHLGPVLRSWRPDVR